MSDNDPKARSQTDAQDYVRAWHRAGAELDRQRLQDLRQLSETEAARRFARLLSQPLPYPLREGSGLVEQQRIFNRLRTPRR